MSSDAAPRGHAPPQVTLVASMVDGPAPNADVHDAARRLLALVRDLPAESAGTGVVLDLVVDGTRCVVSRAVPTPRSGLHGHSAPAATAVLTPREQEIARMVAEGCTNKEIASVLEISSWTVSTHLRRIFGKLDVGTRAAMVSQLAGPFRP